MSAKIGLILLVSGKSFKGKNRIVEHGNLWEIVGLTHNVDFDSRYGEWVLLKALSGNYTRWMLLNQDLDFTVMGVQ